MDTEKVWVLRTHLSGVWLGRFLGEGELPGEYRLRARRLHRWEGNRLACVDVARLGLQSGDRVEHEGEPYVYLSDFAERHVMSAAAIATIDTVEVWSG